MKQQNRIVHIVVAVLVTITLLHAGFRMFRSDTGVPRHVYSGSRGERLETWNNMRRLELTDQNISDFIDAILSNPTLPAPKGTFEVNYDYLSDLQRADIREALMGFFKAYRENEPAPVYNYLALSRGPTQFEPEFKKNIQDIARQSGYTLPLETDAEAFMYLWNYFESNGIGWDFLLDGSVMHCFWKIKVPLTPETSIQMVLTDPNLFGNITTRGHMFAGTLKLNERLSQGNEVLFCDVFFVAELNKEKDRDFCATGVRFWFDEVRRKWVPHTLALVTPVVRQDLQFPF